VRRRGRRGNDPSRQTLASNCYWRAHAEHWENATGVRRYCCVSRGELDRRKDHAVWAWLLCEEGKALRLRPGRTHLRDQLGAWFEPENGQRTISDRWRSKVILAENQARLFG